jgi:NADPH:quinone reductase-like Zn-dependent oxidoreductase
VKAIQIDRYGDSDVMYVNDKTSLPKPTKEKLLVDVVAAGVNPIDWKIRQGIMKDMINLEFPATLGMDFSGVIKQIGEDTLTDLKVGDEVYGQASLTNGGSGAFAEMAIANNETVAPKPKDLKFEEASAIPLLGVSAWQALVENMKLTNGQKILIHGGAGGIGSIAIQLAKKMDAFVATTVSSDDKQFVLDLGADEIIDYKTQNFEELLHDYDAVFDTVGGETFRKSFRVLKKENGIIVSMLEQPDTNLESKYDVKSIFQFTKVNREHLTQLAEWLSTNKIKIHIEQVFSLEESAKALEYVKEKHPQGKVILKMQQ